MDPIRRLFSYIYATMYEDLDMVPSFLKLWYHFFEKINCGKKTFKSLDKVVNMCPIIRHRILLHASLFCVIRFSKRLDLDLL